MAYAVLAAADVLIQLVPRHPLVFVLPVLLMPLLAASLLADAPRSRLVTLVVVALGFSWLGDVLGAGVLLKIAFFLVAQFFFVRAFWPYRAHSLLGRPRVLVAFAVVLVALTVLMASHAGPVGAAVAVYGLCLGLMVVLAPGVDRRVGIGAALFFCSDLTLGYDFFFATGDPVWTGVVVMATYLPAQWLIVSGVRRRARADERTRSGPAVARAH